MSSLSASIANTQNNISAEFKAEGIADKNDIKEIKAIIKERVQIILEKLKKC